MRKMLEINFTLKGAVPYNLFCFLIISLKYLEMWLLCLTDDIPIFSLSPGRQAPMGQARYIYRDTVATRRKTGSEDVGQELSKRRV